MTIIQPTKPPDITPDKWTSEIWHYILKFLQPLDASFLFYSAINGAESLDANRKQEALNAANVDKIMQMQRNQFLAQASYLNFDPETQSPFKIKTPGGQQAQETMELANEAGVKIETINFIKLPPGLHGLKALQLALHELLCTMGKANYSATTSLVSITSETCGTDLLKRLNDTISPKSGDATKQANAGGGAKLEALQRSQFGFGVPKFFIRAGGVNNPASLHPGFRVAAAQRLKQAVAGVRMAVNQAGADTRLMCINDGFCARQVAIFLTPHRNDQAVVDHDGVGLQDGLINIARQQQADVLDHDFSRCASGGDVGHGGTPQRAG